MAAKQDDARNLINSLPDAYALLAPDLTVLAVNDVFTAEVLAPREALVGQRLPEAFARVIGFRAAGDLAALEANCARVGATCATVTQPAQVYEYHGDNAQGRVRGARLWKQTFIPVCDANAALCFLLYRIDNVSGRAHPDLVQGAVPGQADATQDSASFLADVNRSPDAVAADLEDRYAFLTNALPQVVFTASPDGALDFASAYAVEYIGAKTQEEVLGDRWLQLVHADDRAVTQERWEHALTSGEPTEVEHRLRRFDGVYHWFVTRTVPMRDTAGNVFKWFGTSLDIEQLRQAEAAQYASEARYRALMDAASAIIWSTDPSGRFVIPQRKWAAYTGQDWEAHRDFGWMNVIHPDDREALRATWEKAGATTGRYYTEIRIWHANQADFRRCEVHASVIRDAAGDITEWVGMVSDVEDMRHAESVRQRFFAVSPDMVCTLRGDGRFAHVNQRWEETLGFGADTLIGRPLVALVAPDDVEDTRAALERLERGCEVTGLECRMTTTAGDYRRLQWSWVPLNEEGLIYGVARDVTAERARQDILTESEERFRSLAMATASIVWTTDARGAVVSVHPSWEVYTGQDAATYARRGWLEAIHPDARDAALALVQDGASENRTAAVRIRRADGNWRHAQMRSVAVAGADGRIKEYVLAITDIEDQVQAERALTETRERLDFAVDAADIGTFYCPMPLREIVWNPKCKAHFFLAPDAQVDFELFYSLLHPEDREPTRQAVLRAVFDHEPYDIEYRVPAPDGAIRWVRAKGRAYYDAQGKPLRFDGVTIDITRQKSIEEDRARRLESERAEAERVSQLKDEFLATLSHELRTPLNAIFGWTQLLRYKLNEPATLARGIDVIDRNVRQQTRLIEDLLDMSRIVSGKLSLHVQPVQLSSVIDAALEAVRLAADAKGVMIHTHVSFSDAIYGDPARIQQVLWNLLTNAVKFSRPGGVITVTLAVQHGAAEVRVTDAGEGIAPQFIGHVFERFSQADGSTTRLHGGLGLGLSIVRNLVELHGGSVHAESGGLGQGATFVVRLPLPPVRLEALDTSPTHDADPLQEAAARSRLAGVKVLIVDDESDARELIDHLLREASAVTATAASAHEALDILDHYVPDVVVADIGMPGRDGYDFIRAVRRRGLHTPAVALTAFARAEDRIRSIQAGFHTHLPKPVEPAELVAVVASLAGRFVD